MAQSRQDLTRPRVSNLPHRTRSDFPKSRNVPPTKGAATKARSLDRFAHDSARPVDACENWESLSCQKKSALWDLLAPVNGRRQHHACFRAAESDNQAVV